jgi:hypothetical protein
VRAIVIESEVSIMGKMAAIVIRMALLVGFLSFVAGVVLPALLSSSNVAPLLGFMVTGPAGTIVGALWGMLRAARGADAGQIEALLLLLLGTWCVTLLYTLLAVSLSPKFGVAAIALQAAILAVGVFFLYGRRVSGKVPEVVRRCAPALLAVPALVLAISVLPPVTRPWWTRTAQASVPSATARFSFILDKRLDASRHVPLLAIDKRMLVIEWLAAAAIGAGIVLTKAATLKSEH